MLSTLFPRTKQLFSYTSIPNTITFSSLISGWASILFTIQWYFIYASIAIFLCVLLDFLDGYIARYLHVNSEIGKQLDSLVDALVFWLAPALLVILSSNFHIFSIIGWTLLLTSGMYRLARFNQHASYKNKTTFYTGIPITTNGIIFPLLIITQTPLRITISILYLSAILMSSDIKIKKL